MVHWLTGCGGTGLGVPDDQDPDPALLDHPVAYVMRPLPLNQNGTPVQNDATDPILFEPGAALYIKDRASPSAVPRNVTQRAFAPGETYDVRDVSVSFDGERLVFAMRGPFIEGADDDEQPSWNLWEYDIPGDSLRRIVPSNIIADEGHDLHPAYLPDGRIIFSSTRQERERAILVDEIKPQFSHLTEDLDEPALLLHVMNSDGSDIHQISFNQSHDMYPAVLDDGRVVFSRWDRAGGDRGIHFYRTNPDGTGMEPLYGLHSHADGLHYFRPNQLQDGRTLALVRPYRGTFGGGNLVAIDSANFTDLNQPTWSNMGLSTPAEETLTNGNITLDGSISPDGRFAAVFPLRDGTGRTLVSWSPCRVDINGVISACTTANLADPNAVEAPPLYGIWIYDNTNGTQTPLVPPAEGFVLTDAVAAQGAPLPPIIFDQQAGVELDATLVSEGVGLLHIRSVYDVDGVDTAAPDIPSVADPAQTSAAQRPARFLRLIKAVSMPGRDDYDFDRGTAFGPNAGQRMREILGYAPIEPDGSVKIKVPADVAFTLDVVDAQGKRIGQRHQYWLQLRAGEERECTGCHAANSTLPHGRAEAAPPSAYPGATNFGLPFPNTESAIWAELGETMAEARTRISCFTDCAVYSPSVNLEFQDVWTDPAVTPKDPDLMLRYQDLSTPAPIAPDCVTSWHSLCRIEIHYEQHIHPLWSISRPVLDAMDVEIDNRRCTICHNDADAMGVVMVPDAQLDLSDGPADGNNADQYKAYRELLFGDNAQRINDAGTALIDDARQQTDAQGNPLFQTDNQGNPILDPDGNLIPLMEPIPVSPTMSAAGARNSNAFFSQFETGGSHEGDLTAAELRLLAEWLDIGAQYFNDPFDAPVN